MRHRKDIQKELEELNSSLAKTNKPEWPAEPDGYFQSLADNVMDKIQSVEALEEITINQHTGWWEELRNQIQEIFGLLLRPRVAAPAFATVAIIAVALTLSPDFLQKTSGPDGLAKASFEDVNTASTEDLYQYIFMNMDDYADVALEEHIVSADKFNLDHELEEGLLNDYILDHVDENLLLEELL